MSEKKEINIHFHFTNELLRELNWDEMAALEEIDSGEFHPAPLKRIVARFMVDEELTPLTYPAANRILGKLKSGEIGDVLIQFAKAFREFTLPKAKGTSSARTSAPPSVATEALSPTTSKSLEVPADGHLS